ncbi:MAG TPA: polysaccharide biosynthesis tyrosine autokinase [Leptolyngbyaceae cyanobacterium M33_DOE_097]|uniref:non-specific protein-tyrosine kinase n=1 Tax=Oscillatoriales cyanobacterium SpSt-418 TaxID=2282169 RepID=A0A7C3PHE6_9CYAN|nr:polysaccharide biosynthesis tyrosine autokinase [Leptolyngbyaceae cyanobacterium M33_DOE_097]
MASEQNIQNYLSSGASSPPAIAPGVADASDADKPKGLDFGIYTRMLVRNLPLIAITGSLASLPFLFQAFQMPKYYQGNFRILVEPITSQGRAADPSALTRQTIDQNSVDYPTLMQVLQSPELLDKIARQIRVAGFPDVTAESLKQEIFLQNLVIGRVGADKQSTTTRLIEVNYQGGDPNRVKTVLEEFKKGYLRYSLEDRRTRIGGGVQFIEEQLPDLQKRVNTLQNQLQELRQRYQLANPETESEGVSSQLQSARAQRLETQRGLAEQNALYSRLQNQLGLNPDEGMLAASLSENPRYQNAISELKKVETAIALNSARFTDRSPVMESLLQQRDNLEAFMDREAQLTLGARAGAASDPRISAFQNSLRLGLIKQLVEIGNTRQVLEVRENALSSVENQLNQRFLQFPLIVREYNNIQQQLEIATKTLNQFLTQRETLRVEAAQKEVPWEVVSPPNLLKNAAGQVVPLASKPTKPLAMGVGLGLVVGLGMALIKEALQNQFLNHKDIPSITKLPALTVVPQRRGLVGLDSAVLVGARDPFSQAFSSLYTNLRFLPRKSPIHSVVVSSAGVGDGKTTTAAHLAMAAAAMGQKVLLVDADMRSPRLHSLLDVDNNRGFSDLLSDETLSPEAVIQPSPLDDNLFVLPAGRGVNNAARLLATKKAGELVERLKQGFDLVVFDTPNLIDVSDATFLADRTDGMLMVVSVGKVKRPAVKQVLKELDKFQINVLGVVPNHPGRGYVAYPQSLPTPELAPAQEPALLENLNIFRTPLPPVTEKQRSDTN